MMRSWTATAACWTRTGGADQILLVAKYAEQLHGRSATYSPRATEGQLKALMTPERA